MALMPCNLQRLQNLINGIIHHVSKEIEHVISTKQITGKLLVSSPKMTVAYPMSCVHVSKIILANLKLQFQINTQCCLHKNLWRNTKGC